MDSAKCSDPWLLKFVVGNATINGKVVFRWILVFVDRSRHNGNIPLPDAPTGSLNCHGQNSTQRGYTDISELAYY